jgi:hypothetical protein
MVERRNAEWRRGNGGMADWRNGGMAEWQNGCIPNLCDIFTVHADNDADDANDDDDDDDDNDDDNCWGL